MYHRTGSVSPLMVMIALVAVLSASVVAGQSWVTVPNGASPQANGPITPSPSIVPPVNTEILKDPSGTYQFKYLGNGQYSTNMTTYERLQNDPYSGIAAPRIQMNGSTVVMTTPQSNTTSLPNKQSSSVAPSYPTLTGQDWSGAGGGFCTFSVSGGGIQCSNPTYTLQTSGVYVSEITWDGHCWNKASGCESSFWTGLSGSNTVNAPLMQNGINVCYNYAFCPKGGSNGASTWNMWWTIISQYSTDQIINLYPTSINGTDEEYVFAFVNSNTQPTFQWIVGSWSTSLTVNSNYAQSSFVQSEGIIEAPLVLGSPAPSIVTWSPNPPSMTGWYEAAGGTPSGYYGTSYTDVIYVLQSSGGYTEAQGTITGSSSFTDTWACGPQYC